MLRLFVTVTISKKLLYFFSFSPSFVNEGFSPKVAQTKNTFYFYPLLLLGGFCSS